ncbi:MAG: pyridoxamine 5'-phosphate oxidase family protein [bacterium]
MQPAWRADLDRNLAAGDDPQATWAQLATVRPDGGPAVRTVVWRGHFDDALVFTTDRRSAKVEHIAHEPRVELCWYFAATREQLRVAGKMEAVVDGTGDTRRQDARCAVWKTLSDEVRRGFAGGAPGRPVDGAPETPETPPADSTPPESFALLILWPEQVDHVVLATTPHQRRLHARDTAGIWHDRAVHP